MNNPLILLVGQSGSGKTTIANYLEVYRGYKQLQSFSTRLPRYEGEIGHTFITDEEFDNLTDIVAYTEYNGFRYGTTKEQIDSSDIYVIDVPGVKTLLEKYSNKNRQIFIFYLKSTVATRIDRMVDRGDSDSAILSRLHTDEQYDWLQKLRSITWDLGKRAGINILLQEIDANKTQKEVVEEVLWYLE